MTSRRAGPIHYEVEVRTKAGDWLNIQQRYRLLEDASLRAREAESRGCATRIVRVDKDGTRKVME